MTIFASCGHEITTEQMAKGYWWRSGDYDADGEALSYGCLCPDCVKSSGAVMADSYEEAVKLLEDEDEL